MFEITGNDIINLNDTDLRTLVARLALAELRGQGAPLSSVTAGGNQDAADGGIDVRVECPTALTKADFVPRRLTGFQVKKPDMPPGAIGREMRPDDVLRDVIREIADASGAYIIISAQGSTADRPLADRRQAIRQALHDLPTAPQLHTDFYDRDRLANWTNEYPGIVAWVRSRIGRPLSGWKSINNWKGTESKCPTSYLLNEKVCLIDDRSRNHESLTAAEAIARIRTALSTPRQSVRLIGLSGLGKTRLVEALFEDEVGENPLDPGIALYTDYSEEPQPTASSMAAGLVESGQRAILIIDNCNPATHSTLTRLCMSESSNVSLITVEYDVSEDEPEQTEVFRLQSAPPELVANWLARTSPHISQVDREKIAEFSDGNFRIARALADTLNKGENLGSLRSRDLLERILHQRQAPEPQLMRAAEELSLLYSIEGEDVSDQGELARISAISGIGIGPLYEALVKLRRRGIVQARGRFRAVLPHAIANPLATFALERIPPVDFDRFCANLTPRMLKSISRRLGFLHDSSVTTGIVRRWLTADGPLGNLSSMNELGVQIVLNIAPVSPELILEKLEQEVNGPEGSKLLAIDGNYRHYWIRLIKALAYDEALFERATILLARFLSVEPDGHNANSVRDAFGSLFHIYLSGTRATPEQRRGIIDRLCEPSLSRCALTALNELLETGHFSSSHDFSFGARSRDWGWQPKTFEDVQRWYKDAIELAVKMAKAFPEARSILSRQLRGLWSLESCRDALDDAAIALSQDGPWIEGWLAFRMTLRFDGDGMPQASRNKLMKIIERLAPVDLLDRARAVILNQRYTGLDITDGENDDGDIRKPWEKAESLAKDLGCAMAVDAKARSIFLSEVFGKQQAPRTFAFGRGLAEGAKDPKFLWDELLTAFLAANEMARNPSILGGFLSQAHIHNPGFVAGLLEDVMTNPSMVAYLPYLQTIIGLDEEGIHRLRRAIRSSAPVAASFANIFTGNSPAEQLAELLTDIAALPDGVEVALDLLHMHFYHHREKKLDQNPRLIEVGKNLLSRIDFSKKSSLRDIGIETLVTVCLSGEKDAAAAETVCSNLRATLENTYIPSQDIDRTLAALFRAQPLMALDSFLIPNLIRPKWQFFDAKELGGIISSVEPTILERWAAHDPNVRYPLLGRSLSLFSSRNEEENSLSPVFAKMLALAPDKRAFLGNFWDRLHPGGWSGSLADLLSKRRAKLANLLEHEDADVRHWVAEAQLELDRWIERERLRERESEESFE